MQTSVSITAGEAELISAACIAAAKARHLAVAVAVVDSAGQVLRVERMDGARGFTADLAARKARTATTIGVSTALLASSLNGRPLHSPELVAIGGGSPLVVANGLAGGLGVSGGMPDQDEEILASGLKAFNELAAVAELDR
jgi:glc operon protein GlcG